jgi:hypothetical protein
VKDLAMSALKVGSLDEPEASPVCPVQDDPASQVAHASRRV